MSVEMEVRSGAYILRGHGTAPAEPTGEDLVRQVATLIGAPPDRVERAVRFARGEDVESLGVGTAIPLEATPIAAVGLDAAPHNTALTGTSSPAGAAAPGDRSQPTIGLEVAAIGFISLGAVAAALIGVPRLRRRSAG